MTQLVSMLEIRNSDRSPRPGFFDSHIYLTVKSGPQPIPKIPKFFEKTLPHDDNLIIIVDGPCLVVVRVPVLVHPPVKDPIPIITVDVDSRVRVELQDTELLGEVLIPQDTQEQAVRIPDIRFAVVDPSTKLRWEGFVHLALTTRSGKI